MSILDSSNQPGDNKRTLIAVVLSVVVITAGFMIQGALFPTPAPATVAQAPATTAAPAIATPAAPERAPASIEFRALDSGSSGIGGSSAISTIAPLAERKFTISTDLFEATFTNKGGDLVSLKLKKHKDKDGAVDLLVAESPDALRGLSVAFGGPDATPVGELMNAYPGSDGKSIEFSRTFVAKLPGKDEAQPFVYRKTYAFRDGEYLFGLAVSLENSVNEVVPLDQGGFAYTVTLGPQIGPALSKLPKNANSDFRKFITLVAGKRKEEQVKPGVPLNPKEQPTWAAISGKYFTFIAVPDLSSFATTLRTGPDAGIVQKNELSISRPAIKASKQTDTYYFYFGPKTNAELAKYDYSDRNAFGRSGLSLEQSMDGSNILGWLETILKFFMNIFAKLIPNYGIAIILTTLLVKVLVFPLTRKGSMASARMQELQPKMQELQAKYKGNPQKLNQEMAEFYKREGYNPMSGCLPLLIQFPLFIAMYNLFNTHFDLRGASFIPGWIPDLSQPEAIFTFPTINLVIWQLSAIRVLPIIYLASQLLYGKYTQSTTPGQSASQMKLMMYGMPIFFFFVLYDVPSGLLIYWIASNVLSIVQQVAINDILKKRKANAPTPAPAPVIAPKKKRK